MTRTRPLIALTLLLWAFATSVCAASEVVLLRSDSTKAFFLAHGGDYERLLEPWRALLKRRGIKVRELAAEDLGQLGAPGVVILASTVALSAAERRALRTRLASGWSALGTWAVGARDEAGKWSGYGFIEELFQAQVVPELAPGREATFFLPYGETPLTHALPAGKRIYLMPSREPFLRVRAKNAAARFGDYLRDVAAPGALLAAATFDERGGSRRAFFGFPETSWESAESDVDALLGGTLDWLRGKPIVVKSAWPHPHQAALLLEMDSEDKFENAVRFAEHLERHRLRGTFYALTSEALKYPAVVKRLSSRHEIGYHAEVHDGFAKLAPGRQDERLGAMIRDLAKLLPDAKPARGFRSPYEEYDATTEKLLRARGLRHHAASPDARDDALPGFSAAERGLDRDTALVVLPRTWIDDVHLVAQDARKTEKILLASTADTIAMRAFGLLSVHTQNFAAGSIMDQVTPRFLGRVVAQRNVLWTASGDAIARWWRDRDAVRLEVREEREGLLIRITTARGPVKHLRLVVFPPASLDTPKVQGAIEARVERLDAQRWALVLPELQEGETTLRLRF